MARHDRISRRRLLAGSTAAAAGLGAVPMPGGLTARAATRPAGANDRIRVGVIGSGGRGTAGILATLAAPNVVCVALCDVADFRMQLTCERIEKKLREGGSAAPGIDRCSDYRRVLDRKDVDAVLIATPDHWHFRPFMDALGAGKHIYQEKPMSLTIAQGLEMVAAAEKHPDCVVQIGTQRRSGQQYLKAKAHIEAGHLGRIVMVRCYDTRNWSAGGDPFLLKQMPEHQVDWKRFEEPCATRHAYDSHRYFTWRWFWDYAGGLVTDVGVHVMDVVHWLTGCSEPKSAVCHGGVYLFDRWETPDVVEAVWDYGTHTVTFTSEFGNARIGSGLTIYGTRQTLEVRGNDIVVWDEGQKDKPVLEIAARDGNHHADWIECIRTGKTPNAPVALGHSSLLPSHLANLAYRAGRKITWDAAHRKAT